MFENIFKRISPTHRKKSISQSSLSNNSNSYNINFLDRFFNWINGGVAEFSKYTKSYGENPLVYMVVSKIAKSSASIQRISIDENGDTIDNSVLLDFLKSPNNSDDEIEFRTKINEYLLITGNSFIHIIRGLAIGLEMVVLPTSKVEINTNKLGEIINYNYTTNGIKTIIHLDDMIHIKTSNVVNVDNSNFAYGLSPLQSAWIVVSSSMEKLKADASIFKSRGIIGILSSDGDTPMLNPERERLQDEFDKDTGGSDKYNKIHISSSKLRFLQTGMSPTDLKLLEGIVSSLRLICGVYGMPSVLFNDNESSTFNNVSEAKVSAYTDVYIPLAIKIDKELTKVLNTHFSTTENIIVNKNSIDVLKSSTNNVSNALLSVPLPVASRAIEAMTINETRTKILGISDIGDDGDILMGKNSNKKDGENK